MQHVIRASFAFLLLFVAFAVSETQAQDDKRVLRIAPHTSLTILDPIWTKAYITRNHGYLIYDTLFGMDAKGQIQPQMVASWTVGKDRKVWTFSLRDGLEFHDGAPVTSEDVIASLMRWSKRDGLGQKLLAATETMEAVDARTFRIKLREPFGMVLQALGKPSANVPFIMPKRVAETPADKQIDEYIGSGPFVFSKSEWRPGERIVYLRNSKYKPRPEEPSGTAGGKVAKVDRVEWVIIKDPQTQVNALAKGEIDIVEAPAYESYAALKANPDLQTLDLNPKGLAYWLRFNHLHPPFDNVKVRRAAMAALNQPAFLKVQVGVPEFYRTCFSVYPCGSPNATEKGMEFISMPDMKRAQQLLKESGYDGTPVVLLQPTDLAVIAKLPLVAAQLLRQAGFTVDMQSMDFQTMVARLAKKDSPAKGGWNIYLAAWSAVDITDPVTAQLMNASCEKAMAGWPCDAELEKLRDAYARAETIQARKPIAEQAQVRAMEIGTHVPLGEYVVQGAARKNIKGFVTGYMLVAWNIEKQ
jgi:peptide/nickel transport system substrate-binding protein